LNQRQSCNTKTYPRKPSLVRLLQVNLRSCNDSNNLFDTFLTLTCHSGY